ncbi:MAG: TIGR04211 family SH3 domain-containing protein [Syntrophobacteraceae bacterium]|jgi:SH3 domain protein
MDRFRSALAFAAALAILIPAGAALAAKAYTTDTQELPLRAAPSSGARTLITVPPSSPVELVNPNSYTKVRFGKSGGEMREGWIASRFLSPLPPSSSIAAELRAENEALKERLDELDKEKTGLSQREKELSDKLTKLNVVYEELKGGSANYLKLKSEYDSAKASLTTAQENIQTMIQENENLKLSQRVRWFVAGALVLLFGWFIGWATGRRSKRKKGTYYY